MERTRANANALQWRRWAPLVLLPLLYLTIVSYQLQDLHLSPQPNANALNLKVAGVQQERQPMQQRVRKAETPAPRLAPEPSSSILKGRRTMVLVINFVDSTRCGQTLQSLFANAAHPELLRVSIHDQIFEAKGDLTCVDAYCRLVDEINCRRDQIVSTKVDASQAAVSGFMFILPARYSVGLTVMGSSFRVRRSLVRSPRKPLATKSFALDSTRTWCLRPSGTSN
jgi:hypothetical protein